MASEAARMVKTGFSGFPAEGMQFLSTLKRNNRREWFQPRKHIYEEQVKGPMADLVTALSAEMMRFGPEYVADPAKAIYRIYRDTRFSKDKSPYKTHVAAVFPRRGLGKHSGAGLYFHIAPDEVLIGGGIYAPEPGELLIVRQHIAAHPRAFRSIVDSPALRKFDGLEGEKLKRVPRGFPSDHPAAEYLKYKQFLAGRVFPPEFATSPRLYPALLDCFHKMMPFLRFLNQPLVKAISRMREEATC